MSILDIFEELNAITEDYNGSYQSPYLNLSMAERKTAAQEYVNKRDNLHICTSAGWVRPGLLDKINPMYYILDYTAFHKAYDADLAKMNLLAMFEANGQLGPYRSYGNLKTAEAQFGGMPAFKAAKDLWSRVHADSCWSNGTKIDLTRWRMRMITADVAEEKVRKLKQHETDIKQARDKAEAEEQARLAQKAKDKAAAEALNGTLTELLADALDLIDPNLMNMLEDYSFDTPYIKLAETDNFLVIPNIKNILLLTAEKDKYTADYLATLIETALKEADLPNRLIAKKLGIEKLQRESRRIRDGFVRGFFLNPTSKEVYVYYGSGNLQELTAENSKTPLTPLDIIDSQLVLVQVNKFQHSNSTHEDNYDYRYYSYNENLVKSSTILNILPEKLNHAMNYNELTYYDQGFEQAEQAHDEFVDHEGFDVWLYEKETHTATD